MRKVTFIGAGNIATSLAAAFASAGWAVYQVYSRTYESAECLASRCGAEPVARLAELNPHADLYVLAVPDNSIPEVADALSRLHGVVVHTSGSTPLAALQEVKALGVGVLYPLQTFSRARVVDLRNVPIFVEADTNSTLEFLMSVANMLSNDVSELSSSKRLQLHLSGVFACNFSNHLLALAYRLSNRSGISFKVLQPLVEETVRKAFATDPRNVQTGPAIRNDSDTMAKHSEILGNLDVQLQKIYNELSLSIQKLGRSENSL